MQEVFRAIGRGAINVCVDHRRVGPGKGFARALHRHSARAAGPFVAINTAAIPKDLLESGCSATSAGVYRRAELAP
jgi:two-component system nitrogen regulation response regulator GlnG